VNAGRLLDRRRCCLAVIDVQDFFLAKLPAAQKAPLVARIAWLMRVALALEIPLLLTGEDLGRNGDVLAEIRSLLPAGTSVHDKMVFDLMGQGDIRAAVAATGRDQFVLTGLETDVCVTHSAFGLMAAGHEVAVARDACASPPPHHELGIERLRTAGVTVTTVKGVYYDWLRDVATLARIRAEMGPALPPGLTL